MNVFEKFMYAGVGLAASNVMGFMFQGLYVHAVVNMVLGIACWRIAEWRPSERLNGNL